MSCTAAKNALMKVLSGPLAAAFTNGGLQIFVAGYTEVCAADKTDFGFSTFAHAALLNSYGDLFTAVQPLSPKRSPTHSVRRQIQIELSQKSAEIRSPNAPKGRNWQNGDRQGERSDAMGKA